VNETEAKQKQSSAGRRKRKAGKIPASRWLPQSSFILTMFCDTFCIDACTHSCRENQRIGETVLCIIAKGMLMAF